MIRCCNLITTGVLLLTVSGSGLRAADEGVSLKPLESWSTFFGETKQTLSFEIESRQPQDIRVLWSFSAKGRTVGRGEKQLLLQPGSQRQSFSLRLAIPPVREGVVFPALLTLSVTAANRPQPLAALRRPLWIFPRDPFSESRRSLKSHSIYLYDPRGETAETLEAADFPYQPIRNLAALDAVEGGLLIIGEGVSWLDHRALPEVVLRLGASGMAVLCLAPAEGQLRLPGEEDVSLSMSFQRAHVIQQFDKRLDRGGWPPEGGFGGVSFPIVEDHGEVVTPFASDAQGWRWLEVRYANQGTLVVCGFGIVERSDAGPSPRYLFARLVEQLINQRNKATSPQED